VYAESVSSPLLVLSAESVQIPSERLQKEQPITHLDCTGCNVGCRFSTSLRKTPVLEEGSNGIAQAGNAIIPCPEE
jgi:hypothetical protein